METTNAKLIDLKRDAEALNESINSLMTEAVSYKNATQSLLDAAGTLNVVADQSFKLSAKATGIIDVLSEMDQKLILDIKTGSDLIMEEVATIKNNSIDLIELNESVLDQIKIIEDNQASIKQNIADMIEYSKKETIEIINKIRYLILALGGISIILLLIILFTR